MKVSSRLFVSASLCPRSNHKLLQVSSKAMKAMKADGPPQASTPVSWDPQVQEYMAAAVGDQQFAAMAAALTVPPLHTCVRVNTMRTTPQDVAEQLHQLLADAAPETPNPAATGSRPDPGSSNSRGTSSTQRSRYGITCHPQIPAVVLEGSGPHTVDLSTVSKQVLISRKAGEAVLRGANVFVPGVLGCSAGVNAGDSVAVMIDLGGQGGTVTTRGMVLPPVQDSQQQQWLCAGIGQACMGRVEMFRLQHGVAVQLTQRLYDVPSLNGQLPGLVMLQNLPSIVAAQVLQPPPGSRVLDMCAAPGGKTTMLAQLMGCVGRVYALDRSHAKVDDVRSLAEELGCSSCITAIKMDATKAVAADGVGLQDSPQQQEQPQPQQGQQPQGQQLEQQQQQGQQQQQQEQQQDAAAAGVASGNQAAQGPHQQPPQPPASPLQQLNGQPLQKQLDAVHLQELPQQRQQQQEVTKFQVSQGMSAKAAQRLARRLASMAARGHKAPPTEFRKFGSAPAAPRCPGFAPESFSHVLLDAPCTALGLKPKLAQPLTLLELLEAATYQRQLLAAAVRLVRPGGYLVYSTCSISPAENEANVRYALDTYPCLELVPAEPFVGGPGLRGPADAVRFTAILDQAAADTPKDSVLTASHEAAAAAAALGDWWLTEQQSRLVQRFCPAGPLDTIGFFAAKFRKVASCEV